MVRVREIENERYKNQFEVPKLKQSISEKKSKEEKFPPIFKRT